MGTLLCVYLSRYFFHADVDKQAEDYELIFYPNECDSDELFFQADERVWEVSNDTQGILDIPP